MQMLKNHHSYDRNLAYISRELFSMEAKILSTNTPRVK